MSRTKKHPPAPDRLTKRSRTSGHAKQMKLEKAERALHPMGESGEGYYCKRDDFVRYIAEEVNPARESAGLKPLDENTAGVCFRILNDFARGMNTCAATASVGE